MIDWVTINRLGPTLYGRDAIVKNAKLDKRAQKCNHTKIKETKSLSYEEIHEM